MIGRETFVPAVIQDLTVVDPGEIRAITLQLPDRVEVAGRAYSIVDGMRPGNAFLAKPLGARTGKLRRRMYTRSNCAATAPLELETIVNHTHDPKADTSVWWQSEEVEALKKEGGSIDVRVTVSADESSLVLYENSAACEAANLRLEPDGQWETLRVAALALSTGITPFLAHVRYMAAREFGRSRTAPGCRLTLIVSVRNPRQLMAHQELLGIQRAFPDHFVYHPVLTREWPEEWPYGKGRVVRVDEAQPEGPVDLSALLAVVPDLAACDVRFCGNARARSQLQRGLEHYGLQVPSFRAEVW